MLFKVSKSLVLVLFLWHASHVELHAKVLIGADNNGILYTGRIDTRSPKAPLLSWPGSSIKFKAETESMEIILEDQQGKNYFNVIFNGDDRFPAVLELKKGKHSYDLSYMLNGQPVEIEIFKRTEGHEGGTHFHGIELSDQGKLLKPSERPTRKIAFFGDSITTGMGNEAADNAKDDVGAEKNHYLSYASISARSLNAEHHSISSSGIGFMISWFDHIMPEVYDQISGVGNNDTKWDFSLWQADVVVVNLGQNDSWLIDNEKRLKPEPSDQDIVNAYVAFVGTLQDLYPKAQFICALGSMDATRGDRWPNLVKKAVLRLNENSSGKPIQTLSFDYTGYKKHPRVHQHIKNANKLTKRIQGLMDW